MNRSVVLVTIDSLRADHCGYWGYDRSFTPTIDKLAKEGLVFENAVSPGPSTPESMPAVMTGEFPVSRKQSEVFDSDVAGFRDHLRDHMLTRDTLADQFRRRGYSTGAFTPNPFTSRFFNFDEGFDSFEDFMDSRWGGQVYDRIFRRFLSGNEVASFGRVLLNRINKEEVFKPWESFYQQVREWIEGQTEPYFLWVFLMDAHNPYLSGQGYRTQSRLDTFRANFAFWRQSHLTPFSPSIHEKLVRAYDDAISYTDACIKRFLDDIGDSLLIVHGDHGEGFGEHGFYGHEPYLFEENIHVPLLVGNGPTGTVSEPIGLRRLPEIALQLSCGEFQLSSGQNAVSRTSKGNKIAIRGENWKYIVDNSSSYFYEPVTDETTDRSTEFPERVANANRAVAQVNESLSERRRIKRAAEGVAQ